jgi:hypothetical protein
MYTKSVFKGSSGTTYTATGLTAATAYTFSIKAKMLEFISFSTTVNVSTTSTPAIVYCASQGNSTVDENS